MIVGFQTCHPIQWQYHRENLVFLVVYGINFTPVAFEILPNWQVLQTKSFGIRYRLNRLTSAIRCPYSGYAYTVAGFQKLSFFNSTYHHARPSPVGRNTEEETQRTKRPFACQLRPSLIDKTSITCRHSFFKCFLVYFFIFGFLSKDICLFFYFPYHIFCLNDIYASAHNS